MIDRATILIDGTKRLVSYGLDADVGWRCDIGTEDDKHNLHRDERDDGGLNFCIS